VQNKLIAAVLLLVPSRNKTVEVRAINNLALPQLTQKTTTY